MKQDLDQIAMQAKNHSMYLPMLAFSGMA